MLTYDRWGIIASKESIWKQEEGGEGDEEGEEEGEEERGGSEGEGGFESSCATKYR